MTTTRRNHLLMGLCALAWIGMLAPRDAHGATASDINRDSRRALHDLYRKSPSAKLLGEKAKGILVFPSIVKGGFIFGGQYGQGALYKADKVAGYYNTVAASWGLQAGIQSYGYVLFFMDDASLTWLDKTEGWELGTGPSIVIVDKGMAKSLGTTASSEGVFAYIFSQKGLMAGIGIQGSKITKITPDK